MCIKVVCLAAVCAVAVWAVPAEAATPIFPAGSFIGLVPPPGMVPSPSFEGFEDTAKNAAILLATFPADAFKSLDKSMVPDTLAKQGIDKREPFTIGTGTGFLLSGKRTVATTTFNTWMLIAPAGDVTALVTVRVPDQDSTYTDKTVRDALATLAVRASVPDAERLGLLPFKVANLAGFHIDNVLPGRALMLVNEVTGKEAATNSPDDGNVDAAGHPIDARFLVAALPGGPTEPKDFDDFARVLFDRIGGLAEVRVQDAEPMRIGNQPGYQTLAKAKSPQSGTDLMVIQWLRFGTGGYMQMIGLARADIWPAVFMRLRTVRDSIDAN
jgi:hypothetical protein